MINGIVTIPTQAWFLYAQGWLDFMNFSLVTRFDGTFTANLNPVTSHAEPKLSIHFYCFHFFEQSGYQYMS